MKGLAGLADRKGQSRVQVQDLQQQDRQQDGKGYGY